MKSSINSYGGMGIIFYFVGVIGFVWLIIYLLCDMSMTLNDCLKIRHYKLVSGTINKIHYTDGDGAYIKLKGDYTEYILNDRSAITESDTGKYAEILYDYYGSGKFRRSASHYFVKQLSINRKIVWTDTPSYVIDIVFILFSLVLLIYFISEICKEIKQNSKEPN